MSSSDLPFGSEFSPSQIDLGAVLGFAHDFAGRPKDFEVAVRDRYFASHDTSDYNRNKLANNTKLGMIAYGIVDRQLRLTDFGQRLYDLRAKPPELYAALGQHILHNLHGATLVQCILDMQAGGERVDLLHLRVWLEERGIHFPRGGKHPSMMRLWLEKAGVFVGGWRIDHARFQELLGISEEQLETLTHFTPQQRAYLKTLANLGEGGPFRANEVEKLAAITYGVPFNEKSLAKDVVYPLRDAGYITLERGTVEAGRGSRAALITITSKLIREILVPILEQLEQQVNVDLRRFLRVPLAETVAEVESSDRYIRGLALEALAIRLLRLVDLTYVSTRLRGDATGGAEVDVIFESARLMFSRWQIQCKNTSSVSLDDVAKEVGLTHFLKSNVIVIVSTGSIGPEARRYANKIMNDSNLCIVMIEREDIEKIVSQPTSIIDILTREARHAMTIKALEI